MGQFVRIETEEIVDIIEEAGIVSQVGYQTRFFKAVRSEGPQVCPAREGLCDIRLIIAIMQSADQGGHPIRI